MKITEVAQRMTPTAPNELKAALARAYQRVTGAPASEGVLEALYAQASLETGRGRSMLNYNFGGIKGASASGATVRSKTIEVLGGKKETITDGFRAYATLDEGAEDYVRLMRAHFSSALREADRGSLDGFAHELKRARYYTADEADYAKALHALAGDGAKIAPSSASSPRAPEPGTVEVLKMLDALRGSMLRIATDDE